MLLDIKNLHVKYGNVEVLHGINIEVDEGEIVTILGANGAGKSTTLLAISGLVKPSEGEILFLGDTSIDMLTARACGMYGIGVLWATHLVDEVELDDHLIILHEGRVLAQGSAEEIIQETGSKNVKQAFNHLTREEQQAS